MFLASQSLSPILFLLVAPLAAQHVGAELHGLVTDPRGLPAQGVRISTRHHETSIERTTVTTSIGLYRLHSLTPGTYTIVIAKEGFKSEVRTNILLSLSEHLAVDVSLSLGDVRERIEVEGPTERVETTSAQISRVVSGSTLRELPLNGRDLFQLVQLQAGVVPATNAGTLPFTAGLRAKASVNGARPTMNNVTLDGADINEYGFNTSPGGIAGVQLGVEAIQEFRVISSPLDAEYGRNSGANVQYITKSGTNQLHGSLFEFHRNARLDARDFFDPQTIPPFVRNQFGATFGGPLKPNRTFYFMNYEGLQESRGLVSIATVPDENVHRGLLPSFADPNKLVNVGVDDRIKPFLALFPLPNGPAIGGGLALLQSSRQQRSRESYGVIRVDEYLGARDIAWLRYVGDAGSGTAPFLSSSIPGFPARRENANHYALAGWNHNWNGNKTNSLLLHLNRTGIEAATDNHYPLSISLSANRPLGSISIAGLPLIGNNFVYPVSSVSNTFEINDSISWQIGRHSIRFGANGKRLQINGRFDLFKDGQYSFNDLTALGVPAASGNPALEAFLRATPFVYIGVNPRNSDSARGYRQTYLGGYLQDDWRVGQRLTINLGLRWEYASNPTEVDGRLVNVRNIRTDAAPTPGRIWESVPLNLWSPRLGVAWKINPRTSLRTGFGLLRDQIWANPYFVTRWSEPFYSPALYVLPAFHAGTNGSGIPDPIGLGGPASTLDFASTFRPQSPYILRTTFTLQRDLGRSWVAEASYTGSRGRHLLRSGEANYLPQGGVINPKLGSLTVLATDGTSDYHAGAVSIERKWAKGLQVQGAYTWSKSLDDSSGFLFADWSTETSVSQDFFNRKGDRGRSAFDRRHVFVTSILYDLRGWRVSGIVTSLSNVPFSANLGAFSNAGSFTASPADRPDVVAGSSLCATVTGNPDHWFDPSAFRLPAAGSYGNAARNLLCGPRLFNANVGLTREFRLRERFVISLRLEVFNVLNHTNLDAPTNTQGSTGNGGNGEAIFVGRKNGCDASRDAAGCGILAPNVGRIFRTAAPSRQIQVGLKLAF